MEEIVIVFDIKPSSLEYAQQMHTDRFTRRSFVTLGETADADVMLRRLKIGD